MEILLLLIIFGMPLLTWIFHRKDNTFVILDEDHSIKTIDTTDVFAYIRGTCYIGTTPLPISTIAIEKNNHIIYLK